MTTDEAIGKRVMERRLYLFRSTKKSFSQSFVADQLGMTGANLSRKESGETPFTAVELSKLADLFDCPIGYFYDQDFDHADEGVATQYLNNITPEDRADILEFMRIKSERHRRRETTHGHKAG